MSSIVIEDGVPMPRPLREGGGCKYPFQALEVGQSFFVLASRETLSTPASRWGKRLGRKFAVRKEGQGQRVWRVE